MCNQRDSPLQLPAEAVPVPAPGGEGTERFGNAEKSHSISCATRPGKARSRSGRNSIR